MAPRLAGLILTTVLALAGLTVATVLLLNDVAPASVALIETPIIGLSLPAAIALLNVKVANQLDSIEGKVNGQMDQARRGSYAAGYVHGLNGNPPHYPLSAAELASMDRTPQPPAPTPLPVHRPRKKPPT